MRCENSWPQPGALFPSGSLDCLASAQRAAEFLRVVDRWRSGHLALLVWQPGSWDNAVDEALGMDRPNAGILGLVGYRWIPLRVPSLRDG